MISIIIPVYNAEMFIRRCLDSILSQTYKNYEVLVVNDGSTDSTEEIVQQYISKYHFIKLINQKNKRAAAARNNGIRHAKGEYIAFIDADDFIHKSYLEILYDNLVTYGAEVSTCKFYCSSKDEFKTLDLKQNNPYLRTNIEVMYECCDINKTAITSPWCKIYKKSLFDGIEYPEGRTYEDLATTHKVLYRAKKIVTTDLELYCYYNTEESVVHGRYTYLNFYSENVAQDERLAFFEKLGIDSLNKKNIIAVERNRITNFCRASLYLPDKRKECLELKRKFDMTLVNLSKKYKLKVFDKLLFYGFKYFSFFYVYILYKLYLIYNQIKRK